MKNEAWLGLIKEASTNEAKFVVRSYEATIYLGSKLRSKSGSIVSIKNIKVREFEPNIRSKIPPEELKKYKVSETTPGQNWILDVVGDIDGFSEGEIIYVD